MIRITAGILIAVATLFAAHPLHAQRSGGAEIGVDGEIRRELTNDPQVTIAEFPISRIRAGFFVSPIISLEPAVHLTYLSSNGETDTGADLLVGVLFHFQPDRRRPQPYVRPFVELTHSSFTVVSDIPGGVTQRQSESFSETALGAGLGIKLPLTAALSTRIEGAYGHTLKRDGIEGRNAVSLLIGLSYFTGH
jgi:hypothetical protein